MPVSFCHEAFYLTSPPPTNGKSQGALFIYFPQGAFNIFPFLITHIQAVAQSPRDLGQSGMALQMELVVLLKGDMRNRPIFPKNISLQIIGYRLGNFILESSINIC